MVEASPRTGLGRVVPVLSIQSIHLCFFFTMLCCGAAPIGRLGDPRQVNRHGMLYTPHSLRSSECVGCSCSDVLRFTPLRGGSARRNESSNYCSDGSSGRPDNSVKDEDENQTGMGVFVCWRARMR